MLTTPVAGLHLLKELLRSTKSSWRWGDGGGDFLGIPIRNFNVGTFRREVDIDPGDLFESRYFLVLGDVDHIESTIVGRDLVNSATYDKRTIGEQDSGLLAWQITGENGILSIVETDTGGRSDFMTYALPVNGSHPLFMFEDADGNAFVSVDPYALSYTPYDGETDYKGVLGFVLPSEITSAERNYVDLQTVFAGKDNYLNTAPATVYFALAGISEPALGIILGDVTQDGVVDFSDIPSFIELLSTGRYLDEADVNQDGVVDFSDISPFIAILSGS